MDKQTQRKRKLSISTNAQRPRKRSRAGNGSEEGISSAVGTFGDSNRHQNLTVAQSPPQSVCACNTGLVEFDAQTNAAYNGTAHAPVQVSTRATEGAYAHSRVVDIIDLCDENWGQYFRTVEVKADNTVIVDLVSEAKEEEEASDQNVPFKKRARFRIVSVAISENQ